MNSKRPAKRELNRRDLEERAAKRKKYEDNSAHILKTVYWKDPDAVLIATRMRY